MIRCLYGFLFFFARHLIAGSDRQLPESLTAAAPVATVDMLIYMNLVYIYWLT